MRILAFDTETSGMVKWKERSHHPDQPLPIEIGWIVFDPDSSDVEPFSKFETLVRYRKPPVMEDEALAIHKIQINTSQTVGMLIDEMLAAFREELDQCDVYIAHSVNFDRRIMAAAGHRGGMADLGDKLKEVQNYCTMMNTTKLCGIPQANGRGLKWPTLVEALDAFDLDPIEDEHRAMDDVKGCVRLFRYLWAIGAVTKDDFRVTL